MLITLEGLDGSGKTTAREVLAEEYPEFVFTREPTTSWYGDAVQRSVEDDDADPVAELFLYTADHAAHLADVVRPALAEGNVVISDRYSDSRYAYQAVSIEEHVKRPLEYIRGVHQPWTRPPDATIYLDVDPETGAARSGATNKFEQAAFLSRVQENYERLMKAEPERFVRIDTSRSPEEVLDAVVYTVGRLVEEHDARTNSEGRD
ncbi:MULTISPECIES: dTMP kinase [Halorussus]|uniref:dTMP kinase n=1 Tax=Halorussus TaxID=1070314 RepID=UPI00209F36F8|nr:dTMP kinase [Halorussus vallis]USZ77531.1 dTMP kinase [Halorussus vallis]